MAKNISTQVQPELIKSLLSDQVKRVCSSTVPCAFVGGIPGTNWHNNYNDLVRLCTQCGRDCTELELAIESAKNAMIHLRHVADVQKAELCTFVCQAPLSAFKDLS
jgi:hypothetical protein